MLIPVTQKYMAFVMPLYKLFGTCVQFIQMEVLLAPSKTLTIPRLELLGAVLLGSVTGKYYQ